jgi:hypothetical protein
MLAAVLVAAFSLVACDDSLSREQFDKAIAKGRLSDAQVELVKLKGCSGFYNCCDILIDEYLAIGNFNKAIKFAFASLVYSLPFFVINVGLIIAYVFIANTIFKALIGLMVLSLLTITLDSVKLTLFTHYTGNVIANNANPFSAFGKSIKLELKHFWKIMGYSVVISLTSILINGIIGVFTLFAGLLFSIPATCVLVCIFKIVIFLNINGNRYYLSNSVIYNPQKYVIKKDDYVSTFIPPEEIKEITTTKMKKKYKTKTLKDKPKKATKAKKSNKTKKSKKENLKG